MDLDKLAGAIEYDGCESWSVVSRERVVAFGQLVPKPGGRLHLARLITAPERRGGGLGRLLASHLLETARSHEPSAISLNVAGDNDAAIALYRSLGFVEAERPQDEPAATSLYMQAADR